MKDVEEVGGDFKEVFLFVRRKAGVIEVMSKSTRFVGIFVIEVDKFFSGENYCDFFIVRRIFSFDIAVIFESIEIAVHIFDIYTGIESEFADAQRAVRKQSVGDIVICNDFAAFSEDIVSGNARIGICDNDIDS